MDDILYKRPKCSYVFIAVSIVDKRTNLVEPYLFDFRKVNETFGLISVYLREKVSGQICFQPN